MKTLRTNHRNRGMLWGGILLTTLTLVSLDLAGMAEAQAGPKKHRARGPAATPDVQYRHAPRDLAPGGCVVRSLPLTRRDHRVAKRLSRLTGYRKGRLLHLRAQGLTWYQIGYRLDIHPRLVRRAMHGRYAWRDGWRWRARVAWGG